MGLRTRVLCFLLSIGLFASILSAAPKLRLSTATVGPLMVSSGGTLVQQVVAATNAGDGSLNLKFSSTASWVTVGQGGACPAGYSGCTPIALNFNTAGLSKGTYTALVTVSDSNAYDAPQVISVTIIVGGGVPDKLDFYAAPGGGPTDITFTGEGKLSYRPQGSFLSILQDGSGSFNSQIPYMGYGFRARATPGSLAEGTYNGSVTFSGATVVTADNKTVPVTLRVTSQPIADPSVTSLRVSGAPGAPAKVNNVVLANRGMGTLTVSSVSATTASGGNWLTATAGSGFQGATITTDATNVSPGTYSGTVTINSNAVQGAITIPVTFDVTASSGPVTKFQGVTANGVYAYGDTLAPGTIAVIFGDQLSYSGLVQASSYPLPTTLQNTTVYVNDKPSPLYYILDSQIAFVMPYDLTGGEATVRVDRSGQRGNTVTVPIAPSAPRFLMYGDYAIAQNTDVTLVLPASTGIGHPVKKGGIITLYMVGLGQTVPAVVAGAAAPGLNPGDSLAQVSPTPTVTFASGVINTSQVATLFAGLTPGISGLYAVNVRIPNDAPTGDNVMIQLSVGRYVSNVAKVAITE